MLLAMQPSVLLQPTIPAIVSSFMQFLQGDHVAVGCQILPDKHGCPTRVVGLHAHKRDVDRLLLGELLHVGNVQGAHRHAEFRYVHGVRHAQAVLLHVFDMSWPGIDESDVLAGLHHMGTGISPDRTRSDNGYLPGHASPPSDPAHSA